MYVDQKQLLLTRPLRARSSASHAAAALARRSAGSILAFSRRRNRARPGGCMAGSCSNTAFSFCRCSWYLQVACRPFEISLQKAALRQLCLAGNVYPIQARGDKQRISPCRALLPFHLSRR